MSHGCHAIACKRSIPPEMLMCLGHWSRVPKGMQAEVWRTYRDGQCDDWNITKEYAAAAKAAITAVAEKEGRTVIGDESELKLYDFLLEGKTPPGPPEQGELF